MTKSRYGFTIVELLIVIVVIAILAAITILAYNNITGRSRDAAMQSDAENSAKLLSDYYTVNGQYPATTSAASLPTSSGDYYPSSYYIYNNTANPATYSLVVSNPASADSYMVSNNNNIPTLLSGSPPTVTAPTSNSSSNSDGCGSGLYGYFYDNITSTATGNPTPTIQWQVYSPKSVPIGTTGASWGNISGATTSFYSYYDGSVHDGDYHIFRAIWTSGSFSTTSPTLTVTTTNGC